MSCLKGVFRASDEEGPGPSRDSKMTLILTLMLSGIWKVTQPLWASVSTSLQWESRPVAGSNATCRRALWSLRSLPPAQLCPLSSAQASIFCSLGKSTFTNETL